MQNLTYQVIPDPDFEFTPPHPNKKNMYIFIGYPLLGKTTTRKKMVKEENCAVLNYDTIREKYNMYKNGEVNNADSWKIVEKEELAFFEENQDKNIIVDNTNYLMEYRKKYFDFGKKHNIFFVLPDKLLPYEVLTKRNQKVIAERGWNIPEHILKEMIENFELPTEDELEKINGIRTFPTTNESDTLKNCG